ncbi:MAG TPA: class I SAM-dependent methyltransferase [Verrucomicrobiae bacterium]|nr:class I SAM-dependent methyltransferase [Verrucomicrobiae bacterium]
MKSACKSFATGLVRNDVLWRFLSATVFKAMLYMQRERQKYEECQGRLPDQIFIGRAVEQIFPDLKVRHGVFRGMQYVPVRHLSGALFPKLLGTYEREVHPVLERICRQNYTEIVNVGCAEGYYAVGLALRLPKVKVFAFDTNEEAKLRCRELAELNGVGDRVILGSFCDPAVLLSLPLTGRALIVSDCEGYEKQLFTPEVVKQLAPHDVFIEVHDDVDINISTMLRNRFEPTHRIESVFSVDDIQKAKSYSYPELENYDLAGRKILLGEWRPHIMEWLFIQSRNPAA